MFGLTSERNEEGEYKKTSIYQTMRAYTDDEVEFIAAIAKFRMRKRRIPTLLEGLAIAKSLGWTLDLILGKE